MAELLLIVRLAGRRVAFPAAEVEAVVEIEAITPAPGAPPHVAGLAALAQPGAHRDRRPRRARASRAGEAAARDAVVAVVDGHPYALLVEAVEDVVEADGAAVPLAGRRSAPGWARVAVGTVEAEGELFLLVDAGALIAGPAAQAA